MIQRKKYGISSRSASTSRSMAGVRWMIVINPSLEFIAKLKRDSSLQRIQPVETRVETEKSRGIVEVDVNGQMN